MYVTICLLFFLVVSEAVGAIYQWEDKNGNISFADEWTKIPPEYRNRARKLTSSPKSNSAPLTTRPIPKGGEGGDPRFEQKTDARGNGKKWWRDLKKRWEKKKKAAEDKIETLELEGQHILDYKEMPDGARLKEMRRIKRQIKTALIQRDLAIRMLTTGLPEEARKAGAPLIWLAD